MISSLALSVLVLLMFCLIAAAPDLLAELEKLAAWVGGVLNEQPSVNRAMQKDWEEARAAIAKAKGETE